MFKRVFLIDPKTMRVLKYKNFCKIIVILLILFSATSVASVVRAKTVALNLGDAFKVNDGSSTDPLDSAAGRAGYNITTTSVESLTGMVLTTVLSLLGVVFLILMVYGGYLWMTARGNEDQVKKAKSLITDTIIGLIIVLMAYAISWFVISKMGGATLD